MLFVADLGNINIDMAIYDEDNIKSSFRINSSISKSSDEYGILILTLLNNSNIKKEDIDGAIIASVVPEITYSFVSSIKKYLEIEPLIVGPGLKSGVSIKLENPKELGADRLIMASGAIKEHGNNLLVIDFSTATSFNLIDEEGKYLGGSLFPGIKVSLNALSSKAAKLPEVEIKKVDELIGKDTISAMQSGIYFGYLGMVESLIDRFKTETNSNLKVIATGGFGKLFAANSNKIDIYDGELAFKGLKNIYMKNKRK